MIRDIVTWPDPVLSRVCAPVEHIDAAAKLARDLLETMYAAPGRGLAAPQISEAVRVFVMDVAKSEEEPSPVVMINPVLLDASETRATGTEACLSIPGVAADVERATRIHMEWIDERGERQTAWLEGIAAICAQHELDHLDGLVIFDRLEPGARDAALVLYDGARV